MSIITQKTVFYVCHIEQLPRHFCFESQGCFVFGNDAQRHANKGTQQIAVHRLHSMYSVCVCTLRQSCQVREVIIPLGFFAQEMILFNSILCTNNVTIK